jgi:hypothetical protein
LQDIEATVRKLHAGGGDNGDNGDDGAGASTHSVSTTDRLMLFFHYRPTFWWLHLHVVHLDGFGLSEAVSESATCSDEQRGEKTPAHLACLLCRHHADRSAILVRVGAIRVPGAACACMCACVHVYVRLFCMCRLGRMSWAR